MLNGHLVHYDCDAMRPATLNRDAQPSGSQYLWNHTTSTWFQWRDLTSIKATRRFKLIIGKFLNLIPPWWHWKRRSGIHCWMILHVIFTSSDAWVSYLHIKNNATSCTCAIFDGRRSLYNVGAYLIENPCDRWRATKSSTILHIIEHQLLNDTWFSECVSLQKISIPFIHIYVLSDRSEI